MARRKQLNHLTESLDVRRNRQLDGYADGLLYRMRRFPAVVRFWERYMDGVVPSKSLLKSWTPTDEAAAALDRLARNMAVAFNISQDDARAGILGNIPPHVRLIQVENSLKTGAGAAITSTIRIEVSVLATPDEVKDAYTRARRQLLSLGEKARLKLPDSRTIDLARFAAKYGDAGTEQGRERWNHQNPHQTARCAMNTWRRDLRRALDQVTSPEWLNAAVDAAFMGGLGKRRLDG